MIRLPVYRREDMKRTFKHRITIGTLVMPIILMILTFRILWVPSLSHFMIALILLVVIVLMMERLLHTEYIFDDSRLMVNRGRFRRGVEIDLSEISDARVMRHRILPVRFILIEYGQHQIGVQPVNETGFLQEIEKRKAHET